MTLKDFMRMVPYFQEVRVKGLVTYLDEFEHEIERTMSVTLNAGDADIILPKAVMMSEVETVVAVDGLMVASIEGVDLTKVVR